MERGGERTTAVRERRETKTIISNGRGKGRQEKNDDTHDSIDAIALSEGVAAGA